MIKSAFKSILLRNKSLRAIANERQLLPRVDWLKFIKINFFSKQVSRENGAFFFPCRGGEIKIEKTAKIHLKNNFIFHKFETNRCPVSAYLLMRKDAKLIVKGRFSVFYGSDIAVSTGARLELGSGYCNAGTQIRCTKSIIIGDRVLIARDVYIMDSDSHQLSSEEHTPDQPVHIGDRAWIGARAIILKGVSVGNDAMVAAGAVVTKEVPPHAVAAGVPARIIKTGVQLEKDSRP